jgi:hypothetical protein
VTAIAADDLSMTTVTVYAPTVDTNIDSVESSE